VRRLARTFVISLHTTHWRRSPSSTAASSNTATSLCGGTNATTDPGAFENLRHRLRRAVVLGGRNPMKEKDSSFGVKDPAATTADAGAHGPGIGTTFKPASATANARSAPGSATAGVPASLTSAKAAPL
jgi:hypothetical protein